MRVSFGSTKWFGTIATPAALLPVGCLLAACASGAPYFSGRTQQPIVDGSAVEAVDVAPERARHLGDVVAECWRTDLSRVAEPRRFRYSDLLCDRELLLEGMRRKAAEVGGSLLVDVQCTSNPRGLLCGASVFRMDCEASEAEALEIAERADHPWETSAEFHPSEDFQARPLAQRPPRSSTRVALMHYRRANEASLGHLSVACETCSDEELRTSLRAAAGSLGARSVVELSCADSLEVGRQCRGELAGYAQPGADPGAM